MSGEQLARVSLRLDAVYCLAVGLLVAGSSSWASTTAGVPRAVLLAVGMMTAAWGVLVALLASSRRAKLSTQWVMIANLGASATLALTGAWAHTAVLGIGALVLAVDVAAFAVSQGVALHRMTRVVS